MSDTREDIHTALACHADRLAVMVDAEAYFRALVESVRAAERSVYILGWDMDSRTELLRDTSGKRGPQLGDLLNDTVNAKPDLQAFVLIWDFAMLYSLERQPLPLFNLGWNTHRRVRFHMDGEHPVGASHHEKILVVDDKVAYLGGLDLTKVRWDTSEHSATDPRRVDPTGQPYAPFHDLQVVVEGEAAAALGRIARERWYRATGEKLPNTTAASDPWPHSVEPQLAGVDVHIARTRPAFKRATALHQIKHFYLETIGAAKSTIYIENQYLTARPIEDALAERLRDKDGPEIIIVMPRDSSGWLEESVMGTLRAEALHRLSNADEHGRLGVYYVVCHDDEDVAVKIHAKLLIVDDKLMTVGSANLSNRSMGLDTEANLILRAEDHPKTGAMLTSLRHRLLAEHMNVSAQTIQEAEQQHGSMLKAVQALRKQGATLREMPTPKSSASMNLGREAARSLDPEEPIAMDQLMDDLIDDEKHTRSIANYAGIFIAAAVLLGLVLAWRFTELGQLLDKQALVGLGETIQHSRLAMLWVVAGFVALSMVMFPVTLLIAVTAAVFSPWEAFLYSLAGCLAGALATYLNGMVAGRKFVRNVAGGRLNRLSKRLAERGLVAVVLVRLVPVAPFTVVNMVAGASHISLRQFILGTLLGMAPGVALVTLFTDRIKAAFLTPSPQTLALVAVAGLALVVFGVALKKRLKPSVMPDEDQ